MKNNINEVYCSFELSKLLKDKGFDIPCYNGFLYKTFQPSNSISDNIKTLKNAENYSDSYYEKYYSPSHTLAMDWILYNFEIFIKIGLDTQEDGLNYEYNLYDVSSGVKHIPSGFKTFSNINLVREEALLKILKDIL